MVYDAPTLSRKDVTPYKMITLDDFRWQKGHIKSVSLVAAGLFKNEAVARGADDVTCECDPYNSAIVVMLEGAFCW